MLKIPPRILPLYDELPAKAAVPERFHFLYKKWLRYYLDFCQKYGFEPSKTESLSSFLNKLKDKIKIKTKGSRPPMQGPFFVKSDGVKKETRKNKDLQPQKTTEKLLRNANWTSVYNDLDAEIKIRHYSPKTYPYHPEPDHQRG